MKVQYFPTQEMDCTWYRHGREGANFGAPQALELAGKTVYEEWPTDLFDVNGDGRPDVVGATRGLTTKPMRSCVVAWENTGTRGEPSFTKPARCVIDTTPAGVRDSGSGVPRIAGFDDGRVARVLRTCVGGVSLAWVAAGSRDAVLVRWL